jgi:hypothetical protein
LIAAAIPRTEKITLETRSLLSRNRFVALAQRRNIEYALKFCVEQLGLYIRETIFTSA